MSIQTDPVQSQRLLLLSEKFGFLLAENLDEVGSSTKVDSENICTYELFSIIYNIHVFLNRYFN